MSYCFNKACVYIQYPEVLADNRFNERIAWNLRNQIENEESHKTLAVIIQSGLKET